MERGKICQLDVGKYVKKDPFAMTAEKATDRQPAVCSYFPVATDNSRPNTLEQHEWVLDQHGEVSHERQRSPRLL